MLCCSKVLDFYKNISFQYWPRIWNQIKCYTKGEDVRKSAVLEKEEIFEFFSKVDDEDRYWLVRKVAMCLGYFGGTRCAELRSLRQDSVKPHPEGFQVTFAAAKQPGHTKMSKFLVKKHDDDNLNCAKIIQTYLEALTKDGVMVPPDGPFLVTGSKKKPFGVSKFAHTPIGKNTLYDIPKNIAEFLNLPEPKKYTGHCFRR